MHLFTFYSNTSPNKDIFYVLECQDARMILDPMPSKNLITQPRIVAPKVNTVSQNNHNRLHYYDSLDSLCAVLLCNINSESKFVNLF